MEELFDTANNLIRQYAYLLTLLSFMVGVVGMVIGVVTRSRLRELVRLRERVISSHFQNMRRFKKNTLAIPGSGSIKDQFTGVYKGLLTMISIVINPSQTELQVWLESGKIDKDDYDELFKLKLRR